MGTMNLNGHGRVPQGSRPLYDAIFAPALEENQSPYVLFNACEIAVP
jgi:hypothetical protein